MPLDLATRDIITLALAALAGLGGSIGAAFAAVRWALRKEFATPGSVTEITNAIKETVASLANALKDTTADLQQQIDERRHEHEMLAKDVQALPSYRQIDEIKTDVGALKEGQAVGREKLDGLKEDIGHLRGSFDRLAEDLRRR